MVVIVGNLDTCTEAHLVARFLLGRVDHPGFLHDSREVSKPPINLAKTALAVNIIGVLRSITESCSPGNSLDYLGPLYPEQLVIFGANAG